MGAGHTQGPADPSLDLAVSVERSRLERRGDMIPAGCKQGLRADGSKCFYEVRVTIPLMRVSLHVIQVGSVRSHLPCSKAWRKGGAVEETAETYGRPGRKGLRNSALKVCVFC